MIQGYVVETGQGTFGPFMPDPKSGGGSASAMAAVDIFLARNINRLQHPIFVKPLLDPTKLPR